MFIRIFALLVLSTGLVGCTGTQITVKPAPEAVSLSNIKKYENVGLNQSSTGVANYAPAGNMTDGMVSTMKSTGFAKNVLYPVRPDDKTDITLDTEFTVRNDTHSGSAFVKSFFTGFTLFLLEPVMWYDFDYILEGKAIVTKNGQRMGEASARTDATISAKWLSLGQVQSLESEALSKAKKSLYEQLIRDIKY